MMESASAQHCPAETCREYSASALQNLLRMWSERQAYGAPTQQTAVFYSKINTVENCVWTQSSVTKPTRPVTSGVTGGRGGGEGGGVHNLPRRRSGDALRYLNLLLLLLRWWAGRERAAGAPLQPATATLPPLMCLAAHPPLGMCPGQPQCTRRPKLWRAAAQGGWGGDGPGGVVAGEEAGGVQGAAAPPRRQVSLRAAPPAATRSAAFTERQKHARARIIHGGGELASEKGV